MANEVHTASAGLDPRTQGFASAEEASDGHEAEDVDHSGLDVLGEHVHGPDGEHQARDLRLLGEQLVRVDADWQLDELLATLQVEDKDARQDLLDVEPAGPTDARPGA